MLTLAQAESIAIAHLHKEISSYRGELVVLSQHTIPKSYGWVLFVNTPSYAASNDPFDMLVGLGPVVVRHNGRIDVLSTAYAPEESVAAFEKKHRLR